MKALLMILTLGTSPLWAGDTPFAVFDCTFTRPSFERKFMVEFHEEEGFEEQTWTSTLKGHEVKFEQLGKATARVTIVTGMPGTSYLIPHEYTFVSSLTEQSIQFRVIQRGPIRMKGEMVSLICNKATN